MRIIGIVGGIASGKTTVTQLLAACGAGVLDADRAGHEVLAEEEVRSALRQRWGEAIFKPDGQVDREQVARIVFASGAGRSPELEFLEQLTHSRIRVRLEQRAAELAAAGKKAVVLDAPLLLEAGWNKFCDSLLFVEAPDKRRREWAAQRGWSEADLVRREAAQESLKRKRMHANWIIDNSGSLEQTRQQVQQFWDQVVAPA